MTCTPSSKSWAFNTKITKKCIIEGFYLTEKKPGNLISQKIIPSEEDLALLNKVPNTISIGPEVSTVGLYFGDPVEEKFSETVTAEYTLTYRNTYYICTKDGCDDWYLGPESTVAARNNDLIWLGGLLGKEITSITPKGYQLDKRSREAEAKALAQYESDKIRARQAIEDNTYQNKVVDEYKSNSITNVFIPSMFYIWTWVNDQHVYSDMDVSTFFQSPNPPFDYNVKSTKNLLSGWDTYNYKNISGSKTYFFKKIAGVPDTNNKYLMVAPDAYRLDKNGGYGFKSYGYTGTTEPGVTYYQVNQWDGAGEARLQPEIDGQGKSGPKALSGPYGKVTYQCVTTDKDGNETVSYTASEQACAGSSKNIYGSSTNFFYEYGTWSKVVTGTVSIYEVVEDKVIEKMDEKETTDCATNYDPIPVKGKNYGGGVGKSCECN